MTLFIIAGSAGEAKKYAQQKGQEHDYALIKTKKDLEAIPKGQVVYLVGNSFKSPIASDIAAYSSRGWRFFQDQIAEDPPPAPLPKGGSALDVPEEPQPGELNPERAPKLVGVTFYYDGQNWIVNTDPQLRVPVGTSVTITLPMPEETEPEPTREEVEKMMLDPRYFHPTQKDPKYVDYVNLLWSRVSS